MTTYNGFKPNETRTVKHRRSRKDAGHSVVATRTTRKGDAFSFTYSVVCECGKTYSSRAELTRAFRSYDAHAAKATENSSTATALEASNTTKRSEPIMTNSPNTRTRKTATRTAAAKRTTAKRTSPATAARKATVAKADVAKTGTVKATEKTAKASTAKTAKASPAKAATAKTAKASKASPAKPAKSLEPVKLTTASGVKHPGETWGAIVQAKGTPFAELERNASAPLGSIYRVVKHGAVPNAVLTVKFAEATGQNAKTLWNEVSAFMLAEAETTMKQAKEAAAKK